MRGKNASVEAMLPYTAWRSLIHHVLAFEEANGGRKILSDTQRWKAQFAAYFLGAVSQAQLSLLEQTTNNTAGVAYASPNSWVVKTSKKLSYELRHNSSCNLGQLNDAQFEHLPMLQAFQWAPVKILAFLLSNSKSRFAIHLQLRELMYERIEHWDIYISLSAFQGHTRYSDVASEESFGEKLSLKDVMGHGKVFHCTKPQLGLNQCEWSSAVDSAVPTKRALASRMEAGAARSWSTRTLVFRSATSCGSRWLWCSRGASVFPDSSMEKYLANVLNASWLVGFEAASHFTGNLPNGLGSFRLLCSGEVTMAMVAAGELVSAMKVILQKMTLVAWLGLSTS